MSTIERVNFELCSDNLRIQTRSWPVPAGLRDALLNAYSAIVLLDGEWVTRNTSGELIRATDITTANAALEPAVDMYDLFPVLGQVGSTDRQQIGQVAVPYLGEWAGDTRIFDATAVVGAGAAITKVGQGLKVATITLGSGAAARKASGLVGHGGASDPAVIVAIVDRLPNVTLPKLRIRRR